MVEVRVTLLPSTFSDALEEFVLPVTTTLGFVGLEVMSQIRNISTREHKSFIKP